MNRACPWHQLHDDARGRVFHPRSCTLGRIHPAYLSGGPGIIAIPPLRARVIGQAEAWQLFAAWVMKLV
jgi:hypothetical protein